MHPSDLALDLFGQGRLQESLAHFQLALQQNPYDYSTRIVHASALAQLELWPEMLACLEEGIALHASSPAELCALAWQLFRHGYVRRARQHLEASLQRHPAHPLIARELGRIAQAQGLWETALAYYDQCRHQGLRSFVLEELGRRREAYRAWLHHQPGGQPELAELEAFLPCGFKLHNYHLRYGAILFQQRLAQLEFDVEHGWYYLPNELELAAVVAEFVARQRVFGWPITAVVAAAPEASAVAAVIAAQLGVRCCPSEDLWPEDSILRFGLTADSLGTMRIPNGLTFALSGHNLGPHIDDAPDLTGVAHERPARWQDVARSPELARRVAEYPSQADAYDFCYGHQTMRPQLQPRPGWEERAAALPRPTEAELCGRLRGADWSALDWIDSENASDSLREAAAQALPLACIDRAQPLLEIILGDPKADWRRIWDEFPQLRRTIFYSRDTLNAVDPAQLAELAVMGGDPELRNRAIIRAWSEKWPLSPTVVASLDLSRQEEARIWLQYQPEETFRGHIKWPPDLPMLQAVMEHVDSRLDPSWASEVRFLLGHPAPWVRARAGRCLARWGEASLAELLELAQTPYCDLALSSLADLDKTLAEATAVSLLPTHPKAALHCLLKLESRRGLEHCRQILRRTALNSWSARGFVGYLDAMGEKDEEMLETALMTALLPSARALISRGFPEYWQVFRLQLRSRDYDSCAEELLEWGSPEALDLLIHARNPGSLLDEIEAHGRKSPRICEMIPIARQRLADRLIQIPPRDSRLAGESLEPV